MSPSEIRFAADRMLGRLARMLRLLGYDTVYAADMTTPRLLEIARGREREALTRGDAAKRFPGLANVFSLQSEHPPEQLKEVAQRYSLDIRAGLWTRCTLCNATIGPVDKSEVESHVPPKAFQVYKQFYRCTGCGHIYWQGSHVERILKNLDVLLGSQKR
jgi:uncharacterized protein with PIN domain